MKNLFFLIVILTSGCGGNQSSILIKGKFDTTFRADAFLCGRFVKLDKTNIGFIYNGPINCEGGNVIKIWSDNKLASQCDLVYSPMGARNSFVFEVNSKGCKLISQSSV